MIGLWITLLGCGDLARSDLDGDGYLGGYGDCDPFDVTVHPGALEIWYDGTDQDCDGNDADQDGDGYPAVEAGGTDCWDDPTHTPSDMAVVPGVGWAQPTADQVHPDASETWYDGPDQDCAGDDDFDADADGDRTDAWPDSAGTLGGDCDDHEPAIHSAAVEVCYDAIDQDCLVGVAAAEHPDPDDYDPLFDCDADGWTVTEECDDQDPSRGPTSDADAWYDCEDQNCDGNDGDWDQDGWVPEDYAAECTDWQALHPGVDGTRVQSGDCLDEPGTVPASLNGLAAVTADQVNPGASETWYDGIDQDCQDDSDFDRDGDGYTSDTWPDGTGTLGDDCDDEEKTTAPYALEVCGDGIDNDCDGTGNGCVWSGELDALDADELWTGRESASLAGWALAWVDWDGTGALELAVGAPGTENKGEVYGVPASAPGDSLDQATWSLLGDTAERLGGALAALDPDGSGQEALLIGTDLTNSAPVYAVFDPTLGGKEGEVVSAAGATLTDGEESSGFGWRLLGLDHQGLGHDAVAVGAPRTPGAVHLWHQVAQGESAGDADVVLSQTSGNLGAALSTGDVDGDGLADLVVGDSGTGDGEVFLWLGPITASGTTDDADASGVGHFSSGEAGAALLLADLDQDGHPDLVIGSPGAGTVTVQLGPVGAGTSLDTARADCELSSDSGSDAGWSLAAGQPWTSDERALLIGAPSDFHDGSYRSTVFVVQGPYTGERDLDKSLAQLTTDDASALLGWSLALRDATGDGLDDLAIGAPHAEGELGAAYLWFGDDGI